MLVNLVKAYDNRGNIHIFSSLICYCDGAVRPLLGMALAGSMEGTIGHEGYCESVILQVIKQQD